MELIAVIKDLDYQEINQVALVQYIHLGYVQCDKRPTVEKSETMTKAELQTALTEKGIEHKPAMSKAELQALLDAAN